MSSDKTCLAGLAALSLVADRDEKPGSPADTTPSTVNEVREALDQAADFQRQGELDAAVARAEYALSLAQRLGTSDPELRDEAVLVLDRMVAARGSAEDETARREQEFRAREAAAATDHQP